MPLINCELSLTLNQPKNWVLKMKAAEGENPAINTPTGETFSLSTKIANKLMQQLKSDFKRKIMKNEYR